MSYELIQRLRTELDALVLIDPHTHINPHSPASKTLADILGYHYYTELAHSAGLPRESIEEPGISPKEKVERLVPKLNDLQNTAQFAWLLDICHSFFNFQDDSIHAGNWEALYDSAASAMSSPEWEFQVLNRSRLEAVFLTNEFDDPLTGFDSRRYIPCLRTDDLVFRLDLPQTRTRLEKAAGLAIKSASTLKQALGQLFEHFLRNNARACAISLPPDFEPAPVESAAADAVIQKCWGGQSLGCDDKRTLANFVFWSLTEHCRDHQLPFDLMIGVNRRVYESGVYQGQDLYDQRTSLYQYRRLFNAFPTVTFPISVLTHMANQELVSYAWIFPNIVTNAHWWYSNLPIYIESDCRSRLQGVPLTKQIGYYSDMYKLEFALPKFNMYRSVLAKVLAEDFVISRGWSEQRAVALGKTLLRDNVERIFPARTA